MRVIADFPHPHFKISVFSMNQRYILKYEVAAFEQCFKIPESDVSEGLESIKKLALNKDFLDSITNNFKNMSKEFGNAFDCL